MRWITETGIDDAVVLLTCISWPTGLTCLTCLNPGLMSSGNMILDLSWKRGDVLNTGSWQGNAGCRVVDVGRNDEAARLLLNGVMTGVKAEDQSCLMRGGVIGFSFCNACRCPMNRFIPAPRCPIYESIPWPPYPVAVTLDSFCVMQALILCPWGRQRVTPGSYL